MESPLRTQFFSFLAQTSPEPMGLEIEHAKGSVLFDKKGKEYIDMISGISVSNLGHGNSEVLNAVTAQLQKGMHFMVYGEFIQSAQVELATALLNCLPKNLESVYFVNSGSEAVEGAMKLAKRSTGRTKILSFENGYHGSTQGALSLMGNEMLKAPFRPLLPGVGFLRFNHLEDLEIIDSDTACLVMEPIQGEAGVISADPHFMIAARKKCGETGTLLVFDEAQTGFGRTGTFWAFEQYGVVPDILILAKALGGGMPLGCFIASKVLMDTLSQNPPLGHITTFGGHPVCCAAGLASLKVILREDLKNNALKIGAQLEERLQHPAIQAVRVSGALAAIEFKSADLNKEIIRACVEKGLLVDWFLFNDRSMRIAPPLNMEKSLVEKACDIILESLVQATARIGLH